MGSTAIDKEPCTSALPSGGAYILKEPDDKGSLTVGTYRWLPSEITVLELGMPYPRPHMVDDPERQRPYYANGPTFHTGDTPPARYPTVIDLRIEPRLLAYYKTPIVAMAWVSDKYGLLLKFHEDVQAAERLGNPAWTPVGTEAKPYFDAGQGYEFYIWADRRFVYVHHGNGESVIFAWFRVPIDLFDEVWAKSVDRLRAAVPPPRLKSGRELRRERAKLLRTRRRHGGEQADP